MEKLFSKIIDGWDSWGRIFQSAEAFSPMAERIFLQEGLPFQGLSPCAPGTNAVFSSGEIVIKLFAPKESGLDTQVDFQTELFGLERCQRLALPGPRLLGKGWIDDRYRFAYLLLEKIHGKSFGERRSLMAEKEKLAFGKNLRLLCDRMNLPCEPFNSSDWRRMGRQNDRWKAFPTSFQKQREHFAASCDATNPVYVHGDLNEDNLLIGENGQIRLIDFADALLAPVIYEHSLAACELFRFEEPFLRGFFGEYDVSRLSELCVNGLLLHDFGGNVISDRFGQVDGIVSIQALRTLIEQAIRTGRLV